MLKSLKCITVLVVVLTILLLEQAQSQSRHADLLLFNGNVITMDSAQPRAQAIAIDQGHIVWVGADEAGKKLFGHAIPKMDLHGSTVLPGLIDAHTHLFELGKSLLRLNLKDVKTEQEMVEQVRKRVASAQPGEWVLGWGWDEGKWAAAYPNNQALSRVSPNNPVVLTGLHSFATWANQKALELAGINKQTSDPDRGKILRDEKTGEPTGILLNQAQQLLEAHIPPMTLEQTKKAIELAARECLRNGLTSVHEARISRTTLQALRELAKENRLPLRVYVMLDAADSTLVKEWLQRGPEIDPNHRLTIRAFKIFADGALGSRGAALLAPYSDAPGTKGVMTTSPAEIHALTKSALERGFQVCTHAIGDAANRLTLDAYEQAGKEVPQAHDPRLRIEHAQVLAPEDIPRFAKLGVIASMQPTHCTSDMPWAEKRLGPQRIKGAYAWRSLLQTGVHLPLSSDFPGETLNPFYGIYAAITRQDPQGNPNDGWYPEQKLTLDEALKGYTTEAAYSEFEEKTKGSIEPGKLADLTVISGDLTKMAPKEILSINVIDTFVGGRAVLGLAGFGQQATDPIAGLQHTRERLVADLDRMPRYTCVQTITRTYYDARSRFHGSSCSMLIANKARKHAPPAFGWDRLRLEVAWVNGNNVFSWVGAPKFANDNLEKLAGEGPLGSGDFGILLHEILLRATLDFQKEQVINGKRLVEYSYDMPLEKSTYKIKTSDGWTAIPYGGTLLIDPEAADLARLTIHIPKLPPSSSACEATNELTYGRTSIHDRLVLIPRETRLDIINSSGTESQSQASFANCREYAATVRVLVDDSQSASGPQVVTPMPSAPSAPIPAGLQFDARIMTPIDSDTAAAGDPIEAVLRSPLRGKNKVVIAPAGVRIHGRLTNVRWRVSNLEIAVRFESIEIEGRSIPFTATLETPHAKVLTGTTVSASQTALPKHDDPSLGGVFHFPQEHLRLKNLDAQWITVAPEAPTAEK